MEQDELRQILRDQDERLREQEQNTQVLIQRATTAEQDRLKLWDKKDSLEEKLEKLRQGMEQRHQEVMSAITANKTANAIIKGERGAGKWIAMFLATAVMAVVGIWRTGMEIIQWIIQH